MTKGRFKVIFYGSWKRLKLIKFQTWVIEYECVNKSLKYTFEYKYIHFMHQYPYDGKSFVC